MTCPLRIPRSSVMQLASALRPLAEYWRPCTTRRLSQHSCLHRQPPQHPPLDEETPASLHDRGQLPDQTALAQLQAKGVRPYFYYVDIHGQVFLQDTYPKNFTSCYKDPKFLDFFISRVKPNTTSLFPEYAWLSPCGKELNFVEAADTPIVFHGLQNGQLLWAGTLRTPFLPDQLRVSASTGRLYHPLPRSLTMTQEQASDRNIHRGCTLGLLKSSMVLSELAADLDQDSLLWQGQRFQLSEI